MLWVIPMRKGVADDWVRQTPGMPCARKCDKSLMPASGLVNGWLHPSTLAITGDLVNWVQPNLIQQLAGAKYSHRTLEGGIGHNLPQEAPHAFAQAIVDVDRS
jgi:hypothetical protein